MNKNLQAGKRFLKNENDEDDKSCFKVTIKAGSVLFRIALWDCFQDAVAFLLVITRLHR